MAVLNSNPVALCQSEDDQEKYDGIRVGEGRDGVRKQERKVRKLGRKSGGGILAFMSSVPLGKYLHAQGKTGGDGEEEK